MSTPPLAHHFLSPGLGPFSPPMTFYNPFLNAAPGAPLHAQQHQQQQHQNHMSSIFSSFGALTPQAQAPSQFSQDQHSQQIPFYGPPLPIPGSPHGGTNDGGYFPPVALTGPEPKDYFGDASRVANSITESSTTSRSSYSGTATASSTSASDRPSNSSRATSIPAEGDEREEKASIVQGIVFGAPRAKSSSPKEIYPTGGGSGGTAKASPVSSTVRSSAASGEGRNGGESVGSSSPVSGLAAARRASWTDVGGLRRAVAEMTLVTKGRTSGGGGEDK